MNEFLVLPLIITGVFCVAAVGVALWDTQGSVPALRQVAGSIIPASSVAGFVGVVAASLMTVTSITFSMLLISVQQTSNFLGAVVFDQYLRRRANQFYVGYFIGATAFSFIVFACAGSDSPPVIGAFAALVLTVGSLVMLLLLIHSAVDQMRPECVVNSIHELALRAHEDECLLLMGTRTERRTAVDAEARAVTTRTGGYVVNIDAQRLADVARSAGPEVEMFLPCQLGTYLELGGTIAAIVGVATTDDRFDADTLSAFTLDEARRAEVDSGYSIDQLADIAWMTGTSTQSPFTANAAIHQLRDLIGRWAIIEEQMWDASSEGQEPLPVVYTDGAIERVLRSFGTLLMASFQSRQSDTAALLITSFAHALPRLSSGHHQDELLRSLHAALPSVTQQTESPALMAALAELVDALTTAGRAIHPVQQVQDTLRTATKNLLSDPSTLQGGTSVPEALPTTSTARTET
ncbi:DUF2254 family protein [Arthrobacter sp. Soc17.1.1.1]|uniref:DUF2254 family protein n=1 Tax=Arthrobacter sp. Soc17.1.1.1 TaxID=3121277 RepID=UPI002FE4302F